ncbi:MAG: ORF6N domain-containing protein, partial [Planctomycetota bacterium]
MQTAISSDLAELYGVEVKRLNEQVSRNQDRFPEEFAFRMSSREYNRLRIQAADPG